MTPTNVRAVVLEVIGTDKYDDVIVREQTPEGNRNCWQQGRLIIQEGR